MTMTTASFITSAASRTLDLTLPAALWAAQKIGLIRDYAYDNGGMWNASLIKTHSPQYDDPASDLPRFAKWKDGGAWFFKLGTLVVIIEP